MRSIVIAVALASIGTSAWSAGSLPIANDELLHSARVWEAHDRGDLALLALKKLVAARPDAPEAVQELGELALRMNDMITAQTALDQLHTRFANHAATQAFEVEYRFATRDRLQLASLQRLIETGKNSQANAEFARLFPHGAPQGYLSLEYHSLLARLPGTWQRVYYGLRKLSEQHPDQPRYQYALAQHLMRRDDSTLQGVRALDELAHRDDMRSSEVDDALITGLKQLGPQGAPTDILQRYVQRHREDAAATNLLAQIQLREQQETNWRRDVLALIAPDVLLTNSSQLDAALTQRRQADVNLDAALNSLHALERELPAKPGVLQQTVALWHERGRNSLQRAQYADAKLEIDIAVTLRKQAFESTIALAEELEARGRSQDAGALLTTASELDPASNWLFETRVRWLIKHDQAAQALALLESRPLNAKYAATTRNGLRAAALQQRAEHNQAAAPNLADADLESALELAPTDVWLRYRLAKRYADAGNIPRSRELMETGVQLAPSNAEMRYAQALLLESTDDDAAALSALRSIDATSHTAAIDEMQQRLEHSQALREVDQLIDQQRFDEATRRLDALLARNPNDRSLRIKQAALSMRAHHPQLARDQYAALVAEQPDDLDTRLDYLRALVDSGDLQLARLQLQAVRQQAPRDDAKLQLSIAWRAWSLDDAQTTNQILQPVLPMLKDDADAWLLAARSDLALRQFAAAHEHLLHAEQLNAGETSDNAHALRTAVDARLDDVLSVAVLARHKPGDSGISQFDSLTIPTAWQWALNYEQRLTLRADAVSLHAGTLSDNFSDAQLFGTLYSAGISSARLRENDTQRGVALGVIHDTDFTSIDLGTTPLGFDLPQIVGGAEWRISPTNWLKDWDLKLGVTRRAVTSSVLSYAGMRDPITGTKWGGVTATGPYLQAGLYREQYSVSGSLRVAQLSGTHVLSNQFIGARLAGDYRWLDWSQDASWLGLSLNYWHYQHNLQNYTFGSGGYYSPQTYLSLAVPVEWQGTHQLWSYQARAALALSHSRVQQIAYYPNDFTLQQQAIAQAQANNDGEPSFASSTGTSFSFSVSAKVERLVSEHWVAGGEFSLDHADYYHPVELSLYVRRVFGGNAKLRKPPSGLRPYND